MGQSIYIWCILAVLLCVHIKASPFADETKFLRSTVETVPPHRPIATPVRASVENIPLRNLRDEGDERLPLRDAVEKRPISTPPRESLYKFLEDAETIPSIDDIGGLRNYYGAATYLNNDHINEERLQQGNANLQEMQQTSSDSPGKRMVVCYVESGAAYRAPPLAFTAGLVPSSCTHLHYAFASLHPHTYAITTYNEDYDVVKGGYRIATGLRKRIPGLRVMISVGGEGSDRLFSEMVKEPIRRRGFVDSAVEFMKEHDFDGIDLHWVYPGEKDDAEKDLFTTLLYELREKLSSYGLLLSTVLPPYRYQIEDGYDIGAVSGVTDYAILQGWDMTHGNRDEAPSKAVHHSALHRDPGAASRDQKYDNIEFMVKFIIRRGMAADKLVLGVPLYGRSYTLAPNTEPFPGAPVSGWGDEGPYTQTKGVLAYFEICMAEREGKGSSAVDEDGNSYAVFGNQWVSYDSQLSIVEKMQFVISNGLAGAAAWAIDMDDFRGLCGSPFPILSTLSTTLNGKSIQTDQSSLKVGPCESDIPYLASDEISCAHFHFCTGGIEYKLVCEDDRLYDPSTGFCGHQDARKCIPGQSLRISVDEAARFLSQAYETDFEWSDHAMKDSLMSTSRDPERLVAVEADLKKTNSNLRTTNTETCTCNTRKGVKITSQIELQQPQGSYKLSADDKKPGMTSLKYGIEYYKNPQLSRDHDPFTVYNDYISTLKQVNDYSQIPRYNAETYKPNFNRIQETVNDINSSNLRKFVKIESEPNKASWQSGIDYNNLPDYLKNNFFLNSYLNKANKKKTEGKLGQGTDGAKMTPENKVVFLNPFDDRSSQLKDESKESQPNYYGIEYHKHSQKISDHDPFQVPTMSIARPKANTAQDSLRDAYDDKILKPLENKYNRQRPIYGIEYNKPGMAVFDHNPFNVWSKEPANSGDSNYNNPEYQQYIPNMPIKPNNPTQLIDHIPSHHLEPPQEYINPSPQTGTESNDKPHYIGQIIHSQNTDFAEDLTPIYQSNNKGDYKPVNYGIEYYKHPEFAPHYAQFGNLDDEVEQPKPFVNNYPYPATLPIFDAPVSKLEFDNGAYVEDKLHVNVNQVQPDSYTEDANSPTSLESDTSPIYNDIPPENSGYINPQPPPQENSFQTSEVVTSSNGKADDKRVVCYMLSWAFYRRGDGKFVPEYIDSRLCTHVVYAYASLSPSSLIAKEFDPWVDITNNMYERVTSLKDVKVLLGLGGWTDSAGDKYSRLVSSGTARANFVQNIMAFLKNNSFHGLHLDWNYPVCWQSNCKKGAVSDKANFAKLVQELSKALHAADMELGIGVSGYKEVIDVAYDLPSLSKSADFLSAMTYDYHGGWEPTTAHHTPLTPMSKDSLPHYSIEYAVKALIGGGADPKKINLGLSFYGQSYRLADVEGSKSPGAPAAGPGEAGEFTKQPGMLAYYEICYRVKNLRWKTGRQNQAGPYTYSDNQWVGYDDAVSIAEKVEWALRQGLGGVTAWSVDLDDFNNRCCTEPWPLLRAAGRALGRSVPPPPKAACERPPPPVTPAPPTTTTVAADGAMGAGAGMDHGSHGDHTTTTWPNWSPSQPTTPSTTQTWWQQSTSSATTASTTTTSTTTTRKPTTTKRPTTAAPASTESGMSEGSSCVAGEYGAARGECEAYLQCAGGAWTKHRCAPGLHWNKAAGRCDWPSFAKCKDSPPSEASTATSTLAPMTSRPPLAQPVTTTTRRPTTTTTRRPTTTTTTTTRRPTTSTTVTTTQAALQTEGGSCTGQDYKPVSSDCNAYLHCDGSSWRKQRCAPGLHWSAAMKHCDWPKYAKCDDSSSKPATSAPKPTSPPRPATRPTTTMSPVSKAMEDGPCQVSDAHAAAVTCDSYLLCVSGRWRKQNCPPGLHWDDRSKRCDWMEFAMCEKKSKPTKTPMRMTSTTTRRPLVTRPPMRQTTRKPVTEADNSMKPGMSCRTGTYHAHPRCDKFFVCVNGMLVAQSCAPGLLWNSDKAQCDFPRATSCSDKRYSTSSAKPGQTSMQLTFCETGDFASFPGECTRYRHCLYGKYQDFQCSAGLHWNQEKQICDWPKSAKCKKKSGSKPSMVNQVLNPPSKPQGQKPTAGQWPTLKPTVPVASTTTASVIADTKHDLLNSRYKLVCYFTNWAWYRPGLGQYGPEDIDPSLCTHIVYGFAVLGRDGLITAHDTWADVDNRFYERVVEYKRHGIKVSLALGGWNDSAGDKYSKLVNDPVARAKFVTHAVEFIETYGFDGLDLDWEYPKCWQVDCSKGPDSDKEGFSALVQELSIAMKPKGFLLSSAVSPNKKVIDAGYDVPLLAKHLDWIAVMTYDYHGQWDKKTGHVAPLYYHPDDDNTYFNANYTIHYWMKEGAPASKLVMGMPMYGQSFTTEGQWDSHNGLETRSATGLNIAASSGGEPGEYTRAKGFLAYYEICERVKDKGWNVVKDPLGRMGPYAYKGQQWVSYDDVEILKRKVNFIKSLNLGGGMVWAIDLDDFRNRCGQGKHPLLNTIKKALLDPRINVDPVHSQAMMRPSHKDDDLEDIEVRPGYTKKPTSPRPIMETTQMQLEQSTKKPLKPVKKPTKEEKFKIVCYYTNWAWYRPESGKFSPSDIDPSLCTHIVYAFAVLDSNKLIMKPHDNWLDVENKFYEKVVAFKSHGIKVLLGLGGWNDSAGDKYSRLVNSEAARRRFVVHALDFIQQYDFDGLDLDWEYPKCWQVECEKGPNSDKAGFANLVKELKTAFTPHGLLLSAAVSPSKRVIDAGYDVPVLSANLDWIAVMTYDYHGQWDKKTGHVAPMYVSDEDDEKTFNANFTMHYWMARGAARRKLVMGAPLYGQSFSLAGAAAGLGAAAGAGGDAGDETRARGFLAFYEICERIRVRGWKVHRDPGGRMGPYATADGQWVSFDDDVMTRHKAEFVRANGLGGSMVWAMDLDDFTGKYCGCGQSPLLANINHVLRGRKAPPPCSLEEIQAPESEQTTAATVVLPPAAEVPDKGDSEAAVHTDLDTGNALSLDGSPCNGIKFTADQNDCSKYYLCNNGHYVELTCPSPLYWNKNHCDWPAKSKCRSKVQLRLTAGEENVEEHKESKPIIACYFTNWAFYRPGNGTYGPDQVDASLCTHVIYAWAHIDAVANELVPGNDEIDVVNDFYGKVTELRLKGIKVIIGAGDLESSKDGKWASIAASPEKRRVFVKSVLKFLSRWNFEGLQLAWQYPVCLQTPCDNISEESLKERENFSSLLQELSKALRPSGYELSVMVAASPEIATLAYDPEVLSTATDWVAVAANDYYASNNNEKTSYLVSFETREDSEIISFNTTLAYWSSVIPIRQLVLGLPGYARTYTLRDAGVSGPGAAVVGPGTPGPSTNVPGFLAYYEVCTNILSHGWSAFDSPDGSYSVSPPPARQWAGYLPPAQVSAAAAALRSAGAGGAALWALDLDDWRGVCGPPQPLLKAIHRELYTVY